MATSRRLNPDDAKQNARAGNVKLGPKKNRSMTQPVNYLGGSRSNPGSMYQNQPSSGKPVGSSVSREATRRAEIAQLTGKNRPNRPNQDKRNQLPKNPPKNKIRYPNNQRNRGGR